MNPILKRTVTALTTAALAVCGLIFVPFEVVLPVMIALVGLVHLEFSQMVARKYEIFVWPGVLLGLVWLIGCFYLPPMPPYAMVTGGLLFVLMWLLALFGRYRQPLVAFGTTLLGIVYIPLLLSVFIYIPMVFGTMKLLYVIAIVKASDMGGFALGVAFCKHKMCPSISPNKSWEGMAGSILASVIVSCLFLPVTHFPLPRAVLLGVLAAVVGTLGDLVESRFKRECGVKDSATFMPAGLGGFLDMFDSLIFAPAVLFPFLIHVGC